MTEKAISKADAKTLGLKVYFTGKPCRRGLSAGRLVSTGQCLCSLCKEFRNQKNAEYMQGCRDRNPDLNLEYRANNKSAIAEYNREYRKKNAAFVSELQRHHYLNNKQYYAIKNASWYKNNPDRKRNKDSKRRAARLKSIPAWYDEWDDFVFQEAHDLAASRQRETGIEWNVDHMIPLQAEMACGLHVASNVQVIPKFFNLSKKNKMILTEPCEWLKSTAT